MSSTGDRIEIRSISSRTGNQSGGLHGPGPERRLREPAIVRRNFKGPGLRGDVVLEAASGSVEVIDISDAHLHVKTLSGPITLTDIRNSHLDVHSVSGDVNLHNVTGPSVEVNSGSGRILYDGDPGRLGEYLLSSHTGDLEVSIPASAWVNIKAHPYKRSVRPGISNRQQGIVC